MSQLFFSSTHTFTSANIVIFRAVVPQQNAQSKRWIEEKYPEAANRLVQYFSSHPTRSRTETQTDYVHVSRWDAMQRPCPTQHVTYSKFLQKKYHLLGAELQCDGIKMIINQSQNSRDCNCNDSVAGHSDCKLFCQQVLSKLFF